MSGGGCGVVGDDDEGKMMKRRMRKEKIERRKGRSPRTKFRSKTKWKKRRKSIWSKNKSLNEMLHLHLHFRWVVVIQVSH